MYKFLKCQKTNTQAATYLNLKSPSLCPFWWMVTEKRFDYTKDGVVGGEGCVRKKPDQHISTAEYIECVCIHFFTTLDHSMNIYIFI